MTTDPLPSSTTETNRGSIPAADIGRRLGALLEEPRPASLLTVVGFSSTDTTVIHRTLARPDDILLGFALPHRYGALGVIASSVISTSPDQAHQDGSLALGLNRRGDTVSMLKTSERTLTTTNPQGWLMDACLRAVALPTQSCSVAALALPIALWLDRLMVALVHHTGPPLGWSDAVDLCPTPRRWRSLDPVDLGITLGSTAQSWRTLRLAAARGAPTPVDVSSKHAAWMDDAMFARWCMGAFPDATSLRCDVDFLAPPAIAEGIEVALRAAWLAFER